VDARLDALIDPLLLGPPVNVALGLEDILAAAAEAEHRPAHRFDRDISGEDEEIRPADLVAIFLLDRPEEAARLVEIAIVGPAVERSKALLPAVCPAAAVSGAIGARRVPRHANEEGTIVPVVRGPPRLAVGHQGFEIVLERLIVER